MEYLDELFQLSGYNPNQPRIPSGVPEGGEWTGGDGGGASASSASSALTPSQTEQQPDPAGRKRVSISRETDKALLIKDKDGNEGWIQKRWMREDGTVSKDTFDKAVGEFKARAASRDASQAFKNGFHEYSIARETEKAIGLEVKGEIPNLESDFTRTIWIPKSVMKDGKVPGWLIEKKIAELKTTLPRTDIWVKEIGGKKS